MCRVEYEKIEKISASKIRQMCVDNNFYTCGDNRAYEAMFKMCSEYWGNIDDLRSIAWDIVNHSDADELSDYGFDTVYEIVAWVMTLILNNCVECYVTAQEVE